MLPPGHLSAGYLTSRIVIGSLHYSFTEYQYNMLILIGTVLGALPDLDFFIAFAKTGSFTIDNSKANHRKFATHAPLLWFAAGLIIFFSAQSDFYKTIGLLVWICSWVHFALDSAYGIMWLWPFSTRLYPFSEAYYAGKYAEVPAPDHKPFLTYWKDFLISEYRKSQALLELILFLIALYTALH